jgi:hypothetical protein
MGESDKSQSPTDARAGIATTRSDIIKSIRLKLTAPPIAASFLVVFLADLEPQRQSAFGRYVKRMMTRAMEAIRLAGGIVMVFGAGIIRFADRCGSIDSHRRVAERVC